jgi:hypothetical protein
MRRIRIVKAISSRHVVDPDTKKPVFVSMTDWLEERVFADSAWNEGTENEAAARLAACERLQDAFEGKGEGDTVTISDADHEDLSKIARSKPFLAQVLQAKEKRFMNAIAGCERFKDEPVEVPAAGEKKNGKARAEA